MVASRRAYTPNLTPARPRFAPYFFLGKITLGQMTQTAGRLAEFNLRSTSFFYKAVVEHDWSRPHRLGGGKLVDVRNDN